MLDLKHDCAIVNECECELLIYASYSLHLCAGLCYIYHVFYDLFVTDYASICLESCGSGSLPTGICLVHAEVIVSADETVQVKIHRFVIILLPSLLYLVGWVTEHNNSNYCFMALCLQLTRVSGIRRNIHPLTPILIINHLYLL